MKKIVGITGGSGTGKSTVAKCLRAFGARIIDADAVARRVVEKGQPALAEIEEEYGKQVIAPDGTLSRSALAKIVFCDEKALHKLNQITHKYIIEEIKQEIAAASEETVVIDAPLLIESGLNAICHSVVCVTAEKETRIARIMARDGLSREMAENRIASQKEDGFYREMSDFEIRNNGDETQLKNEVAKIIQGVCSE